MNSWRDNVRKVEPYTPGEQPKEEGVIKLNTNENPYPPSDKIKEAMSGIKNLRKYPDPAATKLVEAIASYHGFNKEEVFVGVGSDDVLAVAFMTFFNGKKPIFFPDITYSFYPVWAELFGIPYEKKAVNDAFEIQKEDYYAENGGVVFPNPNAPTGAFLSLEVVEDIIQHNQDVVVIVDEAYIDSWLIKITDINLCFLRCFKNLFGRYAFMCRKDKVCFGICKTKSDLSHLNLEPFSCINDLISCLLEIFFIF